MEADVLALVREDLAYHRAEVRRIEGFLDMYWRYAGRLAPGEVDPLVDHEPLADTAPSPAQSQEAGSAEPEASRDTVAGPVCDEDSALHPVAKPEEEATGATAAASDDPASREVDDADRQQLAASGFSGEAAAVPASCVSAAAPVPPQPELPAETEPAGESVSAAPATQPDAVPATKKEMVRRLHEEHPDWPARKIAERMNISRSSVAGHASHLGIKLPLDAPKPDTSAAAPQFYLRDHFGEYLHQSGKSMTRRPSFYWSGTEAEIAVLKEAYPKFADLTMRPVK